MTYNVGDVLDLDGESNLATITAIIDDICHFRCSDGDDYIMSIAALERNMEIMNKQPENDDDSYEQSTWIDYRAYSRS